MRCEEVLFHLLPIPICLIYVFGFPFVEMTSFSGAVVTV
nr:MAG TPA: hypothetical protein [Caudoviricetes sp.]